MSVALRTYTYDDLTEMPDDGNRYEIIGGELVVSPGPSSNHQRVVNRLSNRLSTYVWDHELGEVFTAPLDVVLSPYNVVQPDVLFVSTDRSQIVVERGIVGAPDMAVEVLSQRTQQHDLVAKMAMYATAGVREYWIADPRRRNLAVYALMDGQYRPVEIGEGTARSLVVPGFEITLADLFAKVVTEVED